jgi:hypothetical protein
MEPFVLTLEDEIAYYLESNDNVYYEFEGSLSKFASENYFPFLSLIYGNLSIFDFFRVGSSDVTSFLNPRIINSDINKYKFNLANPLIVRFRNERVQKNNRLEKLLQREGIKLIKEIDLEFFEYKKEQEDYFNNYIGINPILGKNRNFKIIELLEKLREEQIKDFENDLNLFGDLENLFSVIDPDKETIDPKQFTAFLDTEKIHLKFALIKHNDKEKIVLTYFGYGNYYPFTKNIKGKKAFKNRFLRYSFDSDLEDFREYLKRPESYGIHKIQELLNKGHLEYENYFNQYLSYSLRLSQTNSKPITEDLDKLFILNQRTRTRPAAFIAYSLFKNEGFEFLRKNI